MSSFMLAVVLLIKGLSAYFLTKSWYKDAPLVCLPFLFSLSWWPLPSPTRYTHQHACRHSCERRVTWQCTLHNRRDVRRQMQCWAYDTYNMLSPSYRANTYHIHHLGTSHVLTYHMHHPASWHRLGTSLTSLRSLVWNLCYCSLQTRKQK